MRTKIYINETFLIKHQHHQPPLMLIILNVSVKVRQIDRLLIDRTISMLTQVHSSTRYDEMDESAHNHSS